MASSSKTSKGLHQWADADIPSFADFNADNARISEGVMWKEDYDLSNLGGAGGGTLRGFEPLEFKGLSPAVSVKRGGVYIQRDLGLIYGNLQVDCTQLTPGKSVVAAMYSFDYAPIMEVPVLSYSYDGKVKSRVGYGPPNSYVYISVETDIKMANLNYMYLIKK